MNILVAPDSFKGTLSASEVTEIIQKAIKTAHPGYAVKGLPLADGGEGSVDVLAANKALEKRSMVVKDPLFRPFESYYYYEPSTDTAYIEMAKASGITLLKQAELNVMDTTTYGTGQLIKDALRQGARRVIIFVGGSATNDAGLGMAEALGITFRNRYGQKLAPIGRNLKYVYEIEDYRVIPEVKDAAFIVATDVNNPLYGQEGAAHIYAPQKGASAPEVRRLDEGLRHLAQYIENHYGLKLQEMNGAGAAGGLGGGCVAFLNARIQSGADVIFRELHMDKLAQWADVIITGEGKIDRQSLYEKLLAKVAAVAREKQVALWAVCGYIDDDVKALEALGLKEIFSLASDKNEVAHAIENSRAILQKKAAELAAKL